MNKNNGTPSSGSPKIFKAGILVAILVIPASVFIFLKYFATNHFDLPYLVPELNDKGQIQFDSKGDTIFHKIPKFQLIDQDSSNFNSEKLEGKIYVADFIFTRCTTICPKMTNQLGRVQEAFQKESTVDLVSFSIDPSYDSPKILKSYALKKEAKNDKWYFITGDKKAIYDLALNGYKMSVADAANYDKKVNPDETFIHSEKLVLIDKKGYIRGYYDGTDEKDVNRLMVEIKVLLDYYNKEQK